MDYLTTQLDARGETAGVGIDVPEWSSGEFVQVALDGTPTVRPPLWISQIRLTAYAEGKTRAKALANLAGALLLAHPGDGSCAGCLPGPGLITTRDDSTGAELASVGVRMKIRGRSL